MEPSWPAEKNRWPTLEATTAETPLDSKLWVCILHLTWLSTSAFLTITVPSTPPETNSLFLCDKEKQDVIRSWPSSYSIGGVLAARTLKSTLESTSSGCLYFFKILSLPVTTISPEANTAIYSMSGSVFLAVISSSSFSCSPLLLWFFASGGTIPKIAKPTSTKSWGYLPVLLDVFHTVLNTSKGKVQ